MTCGSARGENDGEDETGLRKKKKHKEGLKIERYLLWNQQSIEDSRDYRGEWAEL